MQKRRFDGASLRKADVGTGYASAASNNAWLIFFVLISGFPGACSEPRSVDRTPEVEAGTIKVPEHRESKWFACKQDTDCAVVDDMNCSLASVNRQYIQKFQLWASETMIRRYSDCKIDAETKADSYAPYCEDGRCSFTRK